MHPVFAAMDEAEEADVMLGLEELPVQRMVAPPFVSLLRNVDSGVDVETLPCVEMNDPHAMVGDVWK